MRSTRLLAVSLVFCTAAALGQVPSTDSSAAHSQGATVVNTPAASQATTAPSLLQDPHASSSPTDDPIKAQSQSRKQLIKFLDAQRNGTGFVPGTQFQSDATCFKILSYLMMPDYPNSDSTHYAGYTTCVPSARFRVYTTRGMSRTDPTRGSQP